MHLSGNSCKLNWTVLFATCQSIQMIKITWQIFIPESPLSTAGPSGSSRLFAKKYLSYWTNSFTPGQLVQLGHLQKMSSIATGGDEKLSNQPHSHWYPKPSKWWVFMSDMCLYVVGKRLYNILWYYQVKCPNTLIALRSRWWWLFFRET